MTEINLETLEEEILREMELSRKVYRALVNSEKTLRPPKMASGLIVISPNIEDYGFTTGYVREYLDSIIGLKECYVEWRTMKFVLDKMGWVGHKT